jgi:hypothetical protein
MQSSIKNIPAYYREYGLLALIRHAFRVVSGAAQHNAGTIVRAVADARATPTVDALLETRFDQLRALQVVRVPDAARRVNIVTDSVNVGSLFGGVATALLLAALRANAIGAKLRIVTRTEAPDPNGVHRVLAANGIALHVNPELTFVPISGSDVFLDVHNLDEFITTSWWGTYSTLRSIEPGCITYLLQEDERMFYPHGDDWVRCHETLSRSDIRFLVNTRLLHDSLVADGLKNIAHCATWFEPAFPDVVFHSQARETGAKRRLCFYARPNNLRNLFYRGIELLNEALLRGLFDPEQWEIVFVGRDIPRLALACGCEPVLLGTMAWDEYATFLRTVDLGVYLMATPHPSYPPLDLAASGGVVLTNRFGSKTDLSDYSENIILADLDVESLLEGLRQALALTQDSERRERNYAASGLGRSWGEAFERCRFAGDPTDVLR